MSQGYTSALIVVDLQNDFLAQGGYYDEISKLTAAKDGKLSQADIDTLAQLYRNPPPSCVIRDGYRDLVTRVAEVAAAALARQMPTIFVRTAYNPSSMYRPPLFIAAPERQDYACHHGTWGSELVDPIKRLAADRCAKVVEKHTFDAFFETELRGFLRFHQIDTVYVAGVETNICVLCTALSGLSNGFRTVIVEDCVATSIPALHAPALRIIEVAKGQRMSHQQFLELL
jgi:nicotinamidase-related amidase